MARRVAALRMLAQHAVASPQPLVQPLSQTLTVTVTEGTEMSVDVSPDGTLLVFDLLGQLFTLPVQGGHAEQRTYGPEIALQPQFSLDGRFLVFSSDRGQGPALWRIPVRGDGSPVPIPPADTAGGRRDRFLSSAERRTGPSAPYTVQLVVADGVAQALRTAALVITDSAGRSRRVPLAPEPTASATYQRPLGRAFTPDGRAFVLSDSGQLRRVDLATGTATVIPFTADVTLEFRPLVRFPHRVPDDSLVHARRLEFPRVSPAGRQVVFGAFDRVWVMALPHSTPRRLTALDRIEYEPAWTPDGQYIAFATWSDSGVGGGTGALYRVRADGAGQPERLTAPNGYYRNLAYTADGRYLVAERRTEASDFRETTRGGFSSLSPVSGTVEWQQVWVPTTGGVAVAAAMLSESAPPSQHDCQGAGLAHVDRHPDLAQLSVVAYDGATPQAPPNTLLHLHAAEPAYRPFCLFPAPDGTHLLLQTYGEEWNELYLLRVPVRGRGGASGVPTVTFDSTAPGVRRLTTLARGAEFPHWAPDGRTFTYAFGATLYRYDVAGAEADTTYVPTAIPIDVTWPRDRPRGTVVFRHARLITMRGDTVLPDGDLVVCDRRIVAVGPSGTVTISPEAHVIDATGATIMPGLFDLHDHAMLFRPWRRDRSPQYEANLAFGVLHARDPQALSLDFLTFEDLVATGQMLGPSIRSTGPAFGDPLPPTLIRSLADAQALMRRYAEVYQVGYLKDHYATALPSRAVEEWLVAAAAERQLNVTVHAAGGTATLLAAALDGYGGYEHTYYPRPWYDDMRQVLARTGITLSEQWDIADQDATIAEYARTVTGPLAAKLERFGVIDAAELSSLAESWHPPDAVMRGHERLTQRVLAPLVAAGGRVALGAHGELPGYSTHLNLWALVAGGMTPLEALRSGTLRGAEALGLDQDLGSLAVGKLADLLVLNRNPLENIQNSASLRWVLSNGRLYDAATLDEAWPQPHRRAPAWWQVSPGAP